MKTRLFITVMCMFLCVSLFAKDKLVRCSGTYTYTYSENISHAEGKAKAIENAIIMALADKFGTTVTSQSLLEMTDNGERFNQMSRLHVKGKLVRHIKKPAVSAPVFSDNLFSVSVTVDFEAAPINYAPAEFSAKLLRNGTDDRFESHEFVAGDYFYLSFQSPKSGYVAVFFEDANAVSCILPYYEEDDSPFYAEKGKRYVFFNRKNDEYYFTCGGEPEINYVHVVFSPNAFIRGDLTREMTNKKFRDWLDKRQSYDAEMQVTSAMVRVKPKRE